MLRKLARSTKTNKMRDKIDHRKPSQKTLDLLEAPSQDLMLLLAAALPDAAKRKRRRVAPVMLLDSLRAVRPPSLEATTLERILQLPVKILPARQKTATPSEASATATHRAATEAEVTEVTEAVVAVAAVALNAAIAMPEMVAKEVASAEVIEAHAAVRTMLEAAAAISAASEKVTTPGSESLFPNKHNQL